MSGFIAMSRSALDHPVLQDAERFRAWFWLVANAAWKPTRTRIKGDVVTLERGQLSFSVRFLADSWGWSKSRVDRFLAELRAEGMIETRSKNGTDSGTVLGQGQSIITICNYEKYQTPDKSDGTDSGTGDGTTAGQQRDKEEQRNKENKKTNIEGAALPEWLPADAWAGFVQMRKVIKKPMTDRAAKMIIKTVGELVEQGHDAAAILDQSTRNNWQDVYPVKAIPASKASHLDYGPC